MQEDRNSLFPERMIWSHSIRPTSLSEQDRSLSVFAKWRVSLMGAIAAGICVYLSWCSFNKTVFYVVGAATAIAYIGLVNVIWWKEGAKLRYLLALMALAMCLAAVLAYHVKPLF